MVNVGEAVIHEGSRFTSKIQRQPGKMTGTSRGARQNKFWKIRHVHVNRFNIHIIYVIDLNTLFWGQIVQRHLKALPTPETTEVAILCFSSIIVLNEIEFFYQYMVINNGKNIRRKFVIRSKTYLCIKGLKGLTGKCCIMI